MISRGGWAGSKKHVRDQCVTGTNGQRLGDLGEIMIVDSGRETGSMGQRAEEGCWGVSDPIPGDGSVGPGPRARRHRIIDPDGFRGRWRIIVINEDGGR